MKKEKKERGTKKEKCKERKWNIERKGDREQSDRSEEKLRCGERR